MELTDRQSIKPSLDVSENIIISITVGSIHYDDQEAENEDYLITYKFRRIASQCYGVIAADCLKFTTNTFIGFQIILIAELHKNNADIKISLDQLTWIASLNFVSPIGSIANGFITQHMGNRVMMLLSCLFFIIAWLIFYYASSVAMLAAGQILNCVFNGALKTPLSTYISEISQADLRGSFLATNHMAATLGLFFSVLMGSFVHWRIIALINISFPIFSFLMILFIPESPVWLASKGRFEEAKSALSWLRGWVEPIHVRSEYRSLIEPLEESSSSVSKRSMQEDANESPRSSSLLEPYLHRSFYLPLATMSLIYLIHFLSGVSAVQIYSMVIFEKMGSPVEASVVTAAMGAMRVLGAFLVVFCIRLTGKRRLIFASLIVAGCCYLTIAGVGFMRVELRRWISPLALILAIFANSAGVDMIVKMLNSEVFPVSIRYIGSAIGSSIGSIFQSLMSKGFLYMLDGFTLPGLFLYFALVNCLAIFIYHFVFPETEGRTLREIEEHYGGVRNLKDRFKAKCDDEIYSPLL